MASVGAFRAVGVARPIRYPEEVQIEYHVIDPATKAQTGKAYLSPSMTIEQMWLRYRPVHNHDRERIEAILATGERANLGEVEVPGLDLDDDISH